MLVRKKRFDVGGDVQCLAALVEQRVLGVTRPQDCLYARKVHRLTLEARTAICLSFRRMWVNLDKTADDIDKCQRPWWTKWIAALPPEHREALADYKSKNYPLFAIAQDPDREFSAEDLVRFEALDAALAASPQLPSPIVVWRGFARYRDLFTGETTWNPPALGSLQSVLSWTS